MIVKGHPVQHRIHGFLPGSEFPAIQAGCLQPSPEALRGCVVIRIAHSSHGWAYAHFLAAVAKGNTGVLGGFNRSSQRIGDAAMISALSLLPQVSSSRELFVVGC